MSKQEGHDVLARMERGWHQFSVLEGVPGLKSAVYRLAEDIAASPNKPRSRSRIHPQEVVYGLLERAEDLSEPYEPSYYARWRRRLLLRSWLKTPTEFALYLVVGLGVPMLAGIGAYQMSNLIVVWLPVTWLALAGMGPSAYRAFLWLGERYPLVFAQDPRVEFSGTTEAVSVLKGVFGYHSPP